MGRLTASAYTILSQCAQDSFGRTCRITEITFQCFSFLDSILKRKQLLGLVSRGSPGTLMSIHTAFCVPSQITVHYGIIEVAALCI